MPAAGEKGAHGVNFRLYSARRDGIILTGAAGAGEELFPALRSAGERGRMKIMERKKAERPRLPAKWLPKASKASVFCAFFAKQGGCVL